MGRRAVSETAVKTRLLGLKAPWPSPSDGLPRRSAQVICCSVRCACAIHLSVSPCLAAESAWCCWPWPWRVVQRTLLVICEALRKRMPLRPLRPLLTMGWLSWSGWLSCRMRAGCQTPQGHTKKCQVMLMPESQQLLWRNGGPKFPMPLMAVWAAWSRCKLGKIISSAMFTRQVSSAMASLAFVAASWRMAMPSVVQRQTQALAELRSQRSLSSLSSLSLPSRRPFGFILQLGTLHIPDIPVAAVAGTFTRAGMSAAIANRMMWAPFVAVTVLSTAATILGTM